LGGRTVPPFAGGLIDEFTVGSFVVRRETLAAVVVAEFEQIQREATAGLCIVRDGRRRC
jgi:hypothetical protein